MVDKKAGMEKRDEGDADVGKVYSDLGGNALDKALSDGLHEDVAAAATTGTGMMRQLPLSVRQLAVPSASPKTLLSPGLHIGYNRREKHVKTKTTEIHLDFLGSESMWHCILKCMRLQSRVVRDRCQTACLHYDGRMHGECVFRFSPR